MVICHSSTVEHAQKSSVHLSRGVSRFALHVSRSSAGFTILEIIIILFLLTGLLSFIIPRLNIGDTLNSVGRKWIAALRTFQDMAVSAQRPVRLYIDLDRGQYWPIIQESTEEKAPRDPAWLTPVNLPETIHLTDLQVGSKKSSSGRAELFFYPNGKIDPAVMHFADTDNHVLGVQIEPVTGNIKLTDQRIEPPSPWTLPERLRPLLQIQPTLPTLKPTIPFGQS
ncbi:MAG TPA: hypothetical protein VJ746_18180 [Nitrospira sp.]|nr:hypothetical protein [Nitrospira sp.]